jgi:hypothetical protein
MKQSRLKGQPITEVVTTRAVVMLLGVFALQLGFIASYIGAFHSPAPHDIPVAVVAPAGASRTAATQVAEQLNTLDGDPLDARVTGSESAARRQLEDRDVAGVLVLGSDTKDRLLVASAGGGALSDSLTKIADSIEQQQGRTVTVTDAIAADTKDARGLSAFYLAVGWVVGGYLASAILGISGGAKPGNRSRASARLIGLATYAVLSGLGGALIAETMFDAFGGSFWTLAGLGALTVFAVGAFSMALQVWLGLIGIGVAILLFVVLGNPSAGGAYPAALLPPFWATIGPWLPPGAATSAIRGIIYFGSAGLAPAAGVLAAYAALGVGLTYAGTPRRLPDMIEVGARDDD